MADSTVKVAFLGQWEDLKKTAGQVNSSLTGIADKIGGLGAPSAVAALAGAAVALAFVDASKAAEEDARSQFVLASAIRNNTDATLEGARGAEAYITSMQNSAALADDVLRPALATLVRATGDVATAQDLLGLSADVAAGSGKDLGSVADALAKAFQGNTKSLKALAPELNNMIRDGATAGEVFTQLQKTYAGNAQGLADVSPWQKLNVQLDEAKEKIGVALLPTIEVLAEVVANDVGPALEDLAPVIKLVGEGFALAVEPVAKFAEGVGWLAKQVGKVGGGSELKDIAADVYGAGAAADDVKKSFDGMTQGTKAAESAFVDFADDAKRVKARLTELKSVTFELPDAQRKVADGWAAIDDAAKSTSGTLRDVEGELRSVRDATEGLEGAQKGLLKAEKDLADARKPATARTLKDAELELSAADIKRLQAVNSVGAAEKKLQVLRKDHPELVDDARNAELDLQQAHLDQIKSMQDYYDAQEALTAVQQIGKEGTEDVITAQENLTAAQRDVRNATEQVADAQKAAEAPGQAHEDKTKAIASAYEAQKKSIWDTVEAMAAQGVSQGEIDAFIETSGVKLDAYAAKYKLAKADVDAFKSSLELLAIFSDDARLGAATAGNLVPPVSTQAGGAGTVMSANSAEQRITTRVVVPLTLDKKQLAEAIIEIDRGYN